MARRRARHNDGRNVRAGMLTRVPIFSPSDTVGRALRTISARNEWQTVNYLYLLDGDRRLVGVLSIKELLLAPSGKTLGEIGARKVVSVDEHARPERAAIVAIHHNVKMLPIVDHGKRFLGVIGTDAILETLQRAGIDDAIRYSGIHIEHRRLLDVLHGRVGPLARRRLPWLLIGLGGGFLASLLVGRFESSLREVIELAFFMPAVVYMGAAVGTQTQTLFLRAITIGEVRVARFLSKEIAVDAIIGAVVGAATWGFVMAILRDAALASIVGAAMFFTILLAGLVAVLVASILSARRGDPALGAGPFATVVQDLVSLAIYFVVASVMLTYV